MPRAMARKRVRNRVDNAPPAPLYSAGEDHAQRSEEAATARLLRRAARWPIDSACRRKNIKVAQAIRDNPKADKRARMHAIRAIKDMEAQNQIDDLNAEKMARLDAMKPTEIVAGVDLTDESRIRRAIEMGMVDRLPHRLREAARARMLSDGPG